MAFEPRPDYSYTKDVVYESLGRIGVSEDFMVQIARGQIPGHSVILHEGFNADIDTAIETIWDAGGTYTYPTSAITMYVSSSSTADTSAGTGAQTVYLAGLDANYEEVSETISLTGQTQKASTNTYLRIQEFEVLTAGSGGTAAGTIYAATSGATNGVPTGTVYAQMTIGNNRALMAMYTVPAGYKAYMLEANISEGTTTANQYITGYLMYRPFGSVFRVKHIDEVGNGEIEFSFIIPLEFDEKTDIEMRAEGSSNDNKVSGGFEILLIKTTKP